MAKNTSPEYASVLHFPGVDKNELSKLHMHIAILGIKSQTWCKVPDKGREVCIAIVFVSDEDISGDHLLAEARVSLVKIFPQMQKQFQVCLHKPTFKVNKSNILSNMVHSNH